MVPRHDGAGHRELDTGGATGNTKGQRSSHGTGPWLQETNQVRSGAGGATGNKGRFLNHGA
jgi:hypothetical protein